MCCDESTSDYQKRVETSGAEHIQAADTSAVLTSSCREPFGICVKGD